MSENIHPFEKLFPPIAVELGKLVYAWNLLHEELGQLFECVIVPKRPGCALAAWRALENDRSQRLMVEYAVKYAIDLRPEIVEDILWVLDKANKLSETRNNAIHSPYVVVTSPDPLGTRIAPLDFFGHPRAMKLAGKDLVTEFEWCSISTRLLAGHVCLICFSIRSGEPLPPRPKLPEKKGK
jgi:hypothetical protein